MENIRLNHSHSIKVNVSAPQRRKVFMVLNTEIEIPGGSVDKEYACNVGDTRDASPSPGPEDPLEKGMANTSEPCLENLWTEEAGGPQSTESQRVGNDWRTGPQHCKQQPNRTSEIWRQTRPQDSILNTLKRKEFDLLRAGSLDFFNLRSEILLTYLQN